jgi:large subunit ribosomal protein L24
MKIKKNDNVMVIVGKDRGKSGIVESVFPVEEKAVVKGIHIMKKHVKPSKKNPQGGIIDMNMKLDISNLMLVCPNCGKLTRIGYKIEKGVKIRICKKCSVSVEVGVK